MLLNILRVLDRELFEPVVLSPSGDMTSDFEHAGARVLIAERPLRQFSHYTGLSYGFWDPRLWLNALELLHDLPYWERVFRRVDPGIVCLNAVTLVPYAIPATKTGAAVLCLVQETLARGLIGARRAWLRRALSRWMDGVIFISRHDLVAAKCSAPVVEAIPNWVDFASFDRTCSREAARETLRIPKNAKVVLMLGGISRLKGTLPLVRAAARLSDVPGLRVLIAGPCDLDAESRSALQRARRALRRVLGKDCRRRVLSVIRRHNLGDVVQFLGMQRDVVPLYAAADVVVFPATRAHQARPILEAGAMAKPVVSSRFRELEESAKHEVNALLVKPGDDKKLASALRRIITDKELACRLGEQNYSLAKAAHSADRNGAALNDVFRRIDAARLQHESPLGGATQ
jgi:glycosyltransferase involved in cell wall biosynthesis